MVATAITYRTGRAAVELRTVIVTDARPVVVLLPSGRLTIMQGKLLHGQACAHKFWEGVLDLEGDDFAVPAEQVVRERTIANIKTSRRAH